MASFVYNYYKQKVNEALIDLVDDTIKVALTTSSYTPNQDTHDFFDDITNEVSHASYTAGGATLASKTLTLDTTNDRVDFDAADVVWASATFTARYAVIYKSTGTAATSPLIALIDFGADKSPSAEDFTIVWNAAGILRTA